MWKVGNERLHYQVPNYYSPGTWKAEINITIKIPFWFQYVDIYIIYPTFVPSKANSMCSFLKMKLINLQCGNKLYPQVYIQIIFSGFLSVHRIVILNLFNLIGEFIFILQTSCFVSTILFSRGCDAPLSNFVFSSFLFLMGCFWQRDFDFFF